MKYKTTNYKYKLGESVQYDAGSYVEKECECCGDIVEVWKEKMVIANVVKREREDPDLYYTSWDFNCYIEEKITHPNGEVVIKPRLKTIEEISADKRMLNKYKLSDGTTKLENELQ